MRPLHKLPPDAQEAVRWQAERGYVRPLGFSKEQFEDELAIVLFPAKHHAWRRIRNWTIGVLATVGLVTLAQMLRDSIEPIIGEGPLSLVPVAIVLGAFCVIYND